MVHVLTWQCVQTGQKGVRIRRVDPTAPCSECLRTGDILLTFDGIKIANDGAQDPSHSFNVCCQRS